jgi:hypothetical protein
MPRPRFEHPERHNGSFSAPARRDKRDIGAHERQSFQREKHGTLKTGWEISRQRLPESEQAHWEASPSLLEKPPFRQFLRTLSA